MRLALEDAGVGPADVDVVYASANATSVLDRIEAEALEKLFGSESCVITSIKGAIGESGASGSAACIAALACGKAGRVPPIAAYRSRRRRQVNQACGDGGGCAGPIVLVIALPREAHCSALYCMSTDPFYSGRVAIVTGGSRGIGRGIAEHFVERGAAVGIAYRERKMRRVRSWMRCAPSEVERGQGVRRLGRESVSAFFEQAVAELGPVDILVNNAGVSRDAHIALLDYRSGSRRCREPRRRVSLRACRRAGHVAAAVGAHH